MYNKIEVDNMATFDLVEYTKNVMKDLEAYDMYPTHVNICYKVIMYYENNISKITKDNQQIVNQLVQHVYEKYMESDETELLDDIVSTTVDDYLDK